MQLEKNIGQLLYCHDCVIVPELGGFVANYRSAWVDELKQKVYPPSKEIGFNSNLKRNDGLLIDHVANAERVSYDEAGVLVAEKVDLWNQELNSRKRLDLVGIGELFYDKESNLQFEPDRSVNYLTSSFGMGAVYLPEMVVTQPQEKEQEPGPIIVPLIRSAEEGEPEGKVNMIPAMAAAVVLLIAFGFWLNMRTSIIENGIAELSGLDPFRSAPAAKYSRDLSEPVRIDEFEDAEFKRSDEETYFSYSFTEHGDADNGRVVEWKKPEKAEPVHTAVATPSLEERYHVVGGCFSLEKNALGLIDKLRAEGYDPKLIDVHKGLHRVSVGSYISKQQALRALAAVRKEHTPSAWLLVK